MRISPRGIMSLAALTAGLVVVQVAEPAKEPRLLPLNRFVPIAKLVQVDTAVAEQLRKRLDLNFKRFINGSRDRAEVAAFYRMRGFAPLWIEGGTASARAVIAIDYLRGVENEGLDHHDYATAVMPASIDAVALAESELTLTATILKYARDATNGRIAFSRVSADVDYPPKITNARDILAEIAAAADVGGALASFNPPQPGYKALRAKLAELRGDKQDSRAISSTSAIDAVDTIIANMERWRWMPRDLGHDYVMVNIPNYKLTLMHNGSSYWHSNIVVGAPDSPTPLISASMKSITINPIWHVPQSLVDEYLPALKHDPELATRMGLKIEAGAGGKTRIYQLPGDLNVLGRVRFNFPNKFQVYQHDTDDKRLFGQDLRDSSHGCMRVENPFAYGAALLSLVAPNDGYSEQRLRGFIGDSEMQIELPVPIPVHLMYQTAFVDDDGHLVISNDIYGLDARLLAALKRRVSTAQIAGQVQ